MSWITIIEEEDSSGELKVAYEEIKSKRGKLSNVMKIHSLNPNAMRNHMNLYLSLLFGSSNLSREERELIAVVVSSANKCQYCIKHHAEALQHYWKNDKKIRNFLNDYKSVELPEQIIHMLNYAHKLTKNPYDIKKKDIDKLKEIGFSDGGILNINLIACYFNFVNRIVLGLGVEFSDSEISGYKY